MHPILIDLGTWNLPLFGETHLFLPTYGVLFASAVLTAWLWFIRRARGLDIPEERLFNLTFFGLLAGILGAKVLLVVIDWRTYLEHPGEILATLRSAGVLMGGVVFGALTFILYARRHGMPVWRLADAISAPLALAQAVGRLGCFSAGCCWGRVVGADHPLAIVFTDERAREQTGVPLGQPLIATQLLEFGFDMALCGFLTLLWRRRPEPPGMVFWTYVLSYSLGRGVIEFWRGDAHRGLYLGGLLSTSQLVAIGGIVVAGIMLWRGFRARRLAGAAPA